MLKTLWSGLLSHHACYRVAIEGGLACVGHALNHQFLVRATARYLKEIAIAILCDCVFEVRM